MHSDSVTTYVSPVRTGGRSRAGTIILVILGVLLGVVFGATAAVLPHGNNIAAGVSVLGKDLGGLSKEDAATAVQQTFTEFADRQVILTAGGKTKEVALAALGIQPNAERTVRQALAIGRNERLPLRLVHAGQARWSGLSLTPSIDIDEQALVDTLTTFSQEIDVEPTDAAARWDAEAQKVVITPEQRGAKLDVPASVKLIEKSAIPAVKNGTVLPASITLSYQEQAPKVSADMLAEIDTVLGEFTTSYATSSSSRANNVETATRAINGAIVQPGEEFSYNKQVGPRDKDNGFVIAPVIINGQLVPGMGGGVCQVSTTLYNAALLANLQITMRNHHSLPVHYVPLGQDATVAYGALDLRFKNTTSAPILIESTIGKRTVTMRIFGKGPKPVVHIE
ncbi:MAG TPA: VanW family protein, partial [Armatimonadota bacterium]